MGTDTRRITPRRGIALLLALVTTLVASACVLALWRATAAAARARALERAMPTAQSLADSVLVRGARQLEAGAWRALVVPGQHLELDAGSTPQAQWRATIARVGWHSVLLRATATVASGVPLVQGRADHRWVVPLATPMAMPTHALTGALPWTVDSAAVVDMPALVGAGELACRGGVTPTATGVASFPRPLDTLALPLLDPDTVTAPLVGAFRLSTPVLRTPLRVEGMVVSGTGLRLDADLRLMGVLAVGGTVQTGIGHLDVTGAVVTGDDGGGHSGLGSSDRVQYDACAIRHAVVRVTRPAASAAWTFLGLP